MTKKGLLSKLFLIPFIAMLWFGYHIDMQYSRIFSEKHLSAISDRNIPIEIKGEVFYFTKQEELVYYTDICGFISMIALMGIFNFLCRKK